MINTEKERAIPLQFQLWGEFAGGNGENGGEPVDKVEVRAFHREEGLR